MYTLASDSRTIADEVIALGAVNGHVQLDCGYKNRILDYLAEHGTADTLGGWIETVQEYPHNPSIYTMAFICVHGYLRELFPAEVLETFARIGVTDDNGAAIIHFVLAGQQILPPDVEGSLRPPHPFYLAGLNSADEQWMYLTADI